MPNTNSIGKVMFLTAVARPRYGDGGVVTFDGKIGIWAFVKETPATKNSRNRDKGTLELKSMKVTRDVMRDYLIEKVILLFKVHGLMKMKEEQSTFSKTTQDLMSMMMIWFFDRP